MEDDLICNFKKCRKRITNVAWVTSCSRIACLALTEIADYMEEGGDIFCEEDGSREFSKQQVCPACDSVLSGQLDFIQVDVHPSEQYKSMVLAGQRPETIMEVSSRAMSFWTYQAHQERAYQEYMATKATEKSQKQESYYEQLLTVNQSELTAVKSQLFSLKKDVEAIKVKYNEVSEKLLEKTRQYQKLQGMYEVLRRRNINPSSFDGEADRGSPRGHRPSLKPHSFELPLGSMADKKASLPHSLHKHQSADFFLPSGNLPAVPDLGGGISQVSVPYQSDSSLAAAVNSAAVQATQLGNHSDRFMIKMSRNKQSNGNIKT